MEAKIISVDLQESQTEKVGANISLATGSVQPFPLFTDSVLKNLSLQKQHHSITTVFHCHINAKSVVLAAAMGQCKPSVSLRGTTECVNRCVGLNQPCTVNVLKRGILKCKWRTKRSERQADHLGGGLGQKNNKSVSKMD